jgi:hypothetical protein
MLGLFDSEHDAYRAFVERHASIGRLLYTEQSHGDRETTGFDDAYECSQCRKLVHHLSPLGKQNSGLEVEHQAV